MKSLIKINYLGLILILSLFFGCGKKPTPPGIATMKPAEDSPVPTGGASCDGLRFVGELTASQFEQLFQCLNHSGALSPLVPILLDHGPHEELFLGLYNHSFGHPQTRQKILEVLEEVDVNGGLQDFLSFTEYFLNHLLSTDAFLHAPLVFRELSIERHGINELWQTLIQHPSYSEWKRIGFHLYDEGQLIPLMEQMGQWLQSTSAHGTVASQLLSTLRHFFESQPSSVFTLEDSYQLARKLVIRDFLEDFARLDREEKLQHLLTLFKDLLHSQTTAIFSDTDPNTVAAPSIRNGGVQLLRHRQRVTDIILQHPTDDLATLIKLGSSLHRPLGQLINSWNTFLGNMKQGLDTELDLEEPESVPMRVGEYWIVVNILNFELSDSFFKEQPLERKRELYLSTGPYNYLLFKFIEGFNNKKRMVFFEETRRQLRAENPDMGNSAIEVEINRRWRVFSRSELPTLREQFQERIISRIQHYFHWLYETPLLLDKTIVYLVQQSTTLNSLLQEIAVSSLNLESHIFEQLIQELLDAVGRFFDFNRPIDQFLRQPHPTIEGVTWLRWAITFAREFYPGTAEAHIPDEDVVQIMAALESYQILERLHREKKMESSLRLTLPFIQTLIRSGELARGLKVLRFLHSTYLPDTEDNSQESREHINELVPLLQSLDNAGLIATFSRIAASLQPESTLAINRLIETFFQQRGENEERFITPIFSILRRLCQRDNEYPLEQLLLAHAGILRERNALESLMRSFRRFREASAPEERTALESIVLQNRLPQVLVLLKELSERDQLREISRLMLLLIQENQIRPTLRILIQLMRVQNR